MVSGLTSFNIKHQDFQAVIFRSLHNNLDGSWNLLKKRSSVLHRAESHPPEHRFSYRTGQQQSHDLECHRLDFTSSVSSCIITSV